MARPKNRGVNAAAHSSRRPRETQRSRTRRAGAIFARLEAAYPGAACSLNYKTPLELMTAAILAAQCTDARVNNVTQTLFKKYRQPADYLAVPLGELEEDIRTCGFFRQKAKSIAQSCARILECYGGKVPRTMEELLTLEGVGRKTANVLLGECFNTPGVIVDTHCRRVSLRLGLTSNQNPLQIEQDLMAIWPRESWTRFSHCLVFHGRAVCLARKPRCPECPVNDLCPHGHAQSRAF